MQLILEIAQLPDGCLQELLLLLVVYWWRIYFSPAATRDTLDYVTIASTGNATDFGNLTAANRSVGVVADTNGGLG